ncbi:DUF418 domain-containing protein [Pelagicoccus sp. SDUM812003]|uniref:DUF418 domain-containing protein n=1 Tax=Pelagicoccus sp. SDUM812003 TaxID=3041267 RepID=UPI00280F4B48|nr:DUF418 domain-containing protein [Pelagicoccus sp. SDUM812003]MDQ8205520.1 DUF418 domain-containing protein [Pelagicoccus sp. SDUM812003]
MSLPTTLPASSRYDLVDALRGFAIMGILLLHSIEHFNYYVFPDNALQPEWMVELNGAIWTGMFFIFGSKAYGIFALLFGFTFHLQFSRRAKDGVDFGPIFLWRMLILFGFAWVNSILFPGEVLLIYALLGPILFFMRHLSNRMLLLVGCLFLAQPLELYQLAQAYWNPNYERIDMRVGEFWGLTSSYMSEGSFWSLAANSWTGFKSTFFWSLENGRIEQTAGLFTLGVFIGRQGWFETGQRLRKRWLTVLGVSSTIFAAFLLFEFNVLSSVNDQYRWALQTLSNVWKNLFQIGAMVSLFCSLHATGWFRALVKPLRSYGRMSLSNYMMQSLVGGFIFYPYGLALAEHFNTVYSLLLGFGLFVGFVTFCNLWFLKFKQGPCEMLWHYLTWLPLKRRPIATKQAA